MLSQSDFASSQASTQVPDSAVLLAEESDVATDMEELGLSREDCDVVYESVPLIINLMVEKLKAESSKWAGYIDFLPQNLAGLPFQWDVRSLPTHSELSREQARVRPRADINGVCRKHPGEFCQGHPRCTLKPCNHFSTRLQLYGTSLLKSWNHGFRSPRLRRCLQGALTPCGRCIAGRPPLLQLTRSSWEAIVYRYACNTTVRAPTPMHVQA